MAEKVTVWDAEGIKRTVRSIDAQEIIEAGGTDNDPNAKVEEAVEVAEETAEETVKVSPKRTTKKK